MAIIQGLEWTFNTVAEEYDKWSPEYVPELYADLFAYQPLTSDSEVLEIGIGTGQATTPILKTGWPPDCGGAGRSAGSADAEEIQ